MEQIRIDDGSKTYQIVNHEGKELGVFTFVPTDSNIMERFNGVVDALQTIRDLEGVDQADSESVAEFLGNANKLIRDKMDELFGCPTDSFWAVCGPLTTLSSGQTYVESVLDGIGKIIRKEMANNNKAIEKRMKKYTSAYTE